MSLKKILKIVVLRVFDRFARLIPSHPLRLIFCTRIAPLVLDDTILRPGLVERPAAAFHINLLCDPYQYTHSTSYWCGRFFEIDLENYLLQYVEPGDTVLDIGMNVGHVSISAAARVGKGGQVFAFEPNRSLVSLVQESAQRQGLDNLRIFAFGLGSEEATFSLRLNPGHTGGATFRENIDADSYSQEIISNVKIGDDALKGFPLKGKVFLKMDVEGFEIEALKGLKNTLRSVSHSVVEVSPERLQPSGVATLFELMQDAGFIAHSLLENGRPGPPALAINITSQTNVLFLRGV